MGDLVWAALLLAINAGYRKGNPGPHVGTGFFYKKKEPFSDPTCYPGVAVPG